jgi:predicted ATPase
MYHDEREISADRFIDSLETIIISEQKVPFDSQMSLILGVLFELGAISINLSNRSQELVQDVVQKARPNYFLRLLNEAKRVIEPSDDLNYLFTHVVAKWISSQLGIDYRHPKLIAALVGTVQSTMSTKLIEVMPNTAELSLGVVDYSKQSFLMFDSVPKRQQDLISLRLEAKGIRPNFIAPGMQSGFTQSTFVLDAISYDSADVLKQLEELMDDRGENHLVLIQKWASSEPSKTWIQLLALIKGRGQIEAIINFSSLPTASDQYTAIIISTGPSRRETLYIDVTMSNKSLPPLDGIERMLLAGCIYNLWQGRAPHRNPESVSSGVLRFINSYFSEGFRPISGLCNALDQQPKTISKTRLVSRPFLKTAPGTLDRESLTETSKSIVDCLAGLGEPACIYVIGNNGEGKSFLLKDIVYQLAGSQKRSIGLPISHADRFPTKDNSLGDFFVYKGARKTSIVKEVGEISYQSAKVELLITCLERIGFRSRIYLILKSELAHDRHGQPLRHTLDLLKSEDMQYLNDRRNSISKYEVNFIREGHRTISFENLSSGEQSILGLLIKVIASDAENATFLIDEPEISLHVSWQQKLPHILSLLSRRLSASFVVATHSPVLIANAADEDICYVSKVGRLYPIPIDERHSVETLLMDGFETYTPHNREVHERCAKLVALLISAANEPVVAGKADEAIKKLEAFKKTIEQNDQTASDGRQASDIDLIEKTLGAIGLLSSKSGGHRG